MFTACLACLDAPYQTTGATRNAPVPNVTAPNAQVLNVTAQIEKVQISVPPSAVIQNDLAQNALIPTAMDFPVVRSYQDAMVALVPHCAATPISLEQNAGAPTWLVQI
jgi:hypothetical protein